MCGCVNPHSPYLINKGLFLDSLPFSLLKAITYRVCKHRKEFLIFKLQVENSILLLILKYFSNLDKSTIQHRPSDLSEFKVLMLIFQIEVKYEFVTKIIKSSDQKFVKCLKLKFS